MNKVAEYIKYTWNAKKRHGIHSPYVYALSDKGSQIELSQEEKDLILKYCRVLRMDKSTIEVTDLGSGSKKLGKTRSIRDIYKMSSSKGKYGKLLFILTRHFKPQHILELGTSLGVGSVYMTLGNPKAEITTIEGCPATAEYTMQHIKSMGLYNIKIHVGSFSEQIPLLQRGSYDMIYLDGHHNGQATLKYLDLLDDKISDDTVVVLDDIRWSDDMLKAWEALCKSDKFHISIDLFRMGILVKRPAQVKEHFLLKF